MLSNIHWKIIILTEGSSSYTDTSYGLLLSLDMVILQLSGPTPVNPQAKFSILELAHSSRKHLTTLSSFSLPSLFISNSQQPQHPISSFSPVNQVNFSSFFACLSFNFLLLIFQSIYITLKWKLQFSL
jgi:hypothetical protein